MLFGYDYGLRDYEGLTIEITNSIHDAPKAGVEDSCGPSPGPACNDPQLSRGFQALNEDYTAANCHVWNDGIAGRTLDHLSMYLLNYRPPSDCVEHCMGGLDISSLPIQWDHVVSLVNKMNQEPTCIMSTMDT